MAVSFDYGKCGGCGREQSKTLQNCRECGVALPWNKSAQKMQKAASSSDSIGFADIAWAAMGVQILGGIIFLAGAFLWCGNRFHFFPTFPFAGYITLCIGSVVWGVGSRMD